MTSINARAAGIDSICAAPQQPEQNRWTTPPFPGRSEVFTRAQPFPGQARNTDGQEPLPTVCVTHLERREWSEIELAIMLCGTLGALRGIANGGHPRRSDAEVRIP